jgi:hypothetical protein
VSRGRSRDAPGKRTPGQNGAPPVVVHSITDAAQAHSDDMDLRIRRYLISMGIRTVCVILVLVVHGPSRWVFAGLAIVLPYIAVVMANAAGNRRGSGARPVPAAQTPLSGTKNPEKPTGVQSSSGQPNSESDEWTA